MYNWIDGRKYFGSKILPTLNSSPKASISFMRNAFDLNNFNRLPVIKEEEGYTSDDDMGITKSISGDNSLQPSYISQKTMSDFGSHNNSLRSLERMKESKSSLKLPPLLNINCMMNTEIKQTRSVWDTNFGKRLINGRNDDRELNLTEVKKVRSENSKNYSEKSEDSKSNKSVSKRKPVRVRGEKSVRGDKRDFTENNGKKSSKIRKEKQNSSKNKPEQEKESVKSVSHESIIKSEKNLGTSQKNLTGSNTTVSSNVSMAAQNQRFLTQCIQGILEGKTNEITCEHCNESFEEVEDFYKHQRQHENDKEVCLLCNKEFYNPNEFIQHLLTHEGVDRFSCKKCKKYFPTSKKYKKHCMDYHFIPQQTAIKEPQLEVQDIKKWLPKFQCKRCKIEFDAENKYEAHRRNHIRKDLVGAYLLSPKNL